MKRLSVRAPDRAIAEAIAVLNSEGTVLVALDQNYAVLSLSPERLQHSGAQVTQQLIADRAALEQLCPGLTPDLVRLTQAYMPGGLELIVSLGPKSGSVRPDRVGFFVPLPGIVSSLVREIPRPIYFQEVLDCDSLLELAQAYAPRVELWLDTGTKAFLPATVLDAGSSPPVLCRKGAVPILDLELVLGRKVRLAPEVVFAVLFVCTGNTCRSAMARGLLEPRTQGLGVLVYSAGTANLPGLPASDYAIQAARELGADLTRHRSTALTQAQIRAADLILCMEPGHRERVLELEPGAIGRTFLFTEYTGSPGETLVPDPIGTPLEVFRRVASLIAQGLDKIVADIAERRESPGPQVTGSDTQPKIEEE